MTATKHQPPQAHQAGARTPVRQAPERGYWLSWRECEPWERVVVDRAYAAGQRWAAELVRVAPKL